MVFAYHLIALARTVTWTVSIVSTIVLPLLRRTTKHLHVVSRLSWGRQPILVWLVVDLVPLRLQLSPRKRINYHNLLRCNQWRLTRLDLNRYLSIPLGITLMNTHPLRQAAANSLITKGKELCTKVSIVRPSRLVNKRIAKCRKGKRSLRRINDYSRQTSSSRF